MNLNIKKGNLFELDNKYSLAHCVSQDCDDPKSWGMVKQIIEEEFKDIDINIEVRYL